MKNKVMILRFFSGFRLKVIACFLLINFLFGIIQPTAAWALTSGPSQPEFTSFEPVNTTQLVDNFTGDFNYNIPLLTVPGPNGGYPINLAYHAGAGMEDEASWVGLGWNLNVGEINRQMRGLPDDFDGELVNKKVTMKPNWTVGVGGGVDQEFNGKPVKFYSGVSAGANLMYNSYRGFGIGLTLGLDLKGKHEMSIDLSLDPESGAGLTSSIGIGSKLGENENKFNFSGSYSSRNGLTSIGLSMPRSFKTKHRKNDNGETNKKAKKNSNLNFVSSPSVPNTNIGLGGINLAFTFKIGKPITPFYYPNTTLTGFFSSQFIAEPNHHYPSYGYMYFQNTGPGSMMDYNREKDYPIAPEIPNLPVPVLTHDIYSIKGQGAGGMFRAHRNDIGFLHQNAKSNVFGDLNAGKEIGKFSITIPGVITVKNNHNGLNGGTSFSTNYNGPWKTGDNDVDGFYYKTPDDPVYNATGYRDFYFKNYGEMTAEGSESERFNEDEVNSFNVRLGLPFQPKLENKTIDELKPALNGNLKSKRETVNSNIEHFTIEELKASQTLDFVAHNHFLYDGNELTYGNDAETEIDGLGDLEDYNWTYAPGGNKQIGVLKVRQNDGMVYEYGAPVYNKKQVDVVFSTNDDLDQNSHDFGYTTTNASTSNNSSSRDQYFSRTEINNYAHSHLLTGVYSPDYVDVDGDGPSEDDLGYYTKFNYIKVHSDFKWRAPYYQASTQAGYYSDDRDNKGTYTYGEKEIYYLQSVETKTHIAYFFLEDREDGLGVSTEDMTSTSSAKGTQKLRALREIRLYKKGATNVLLKTVHFEYDYTLCSNVLNNTGSTVGSPNINANKGKLTLKKVWFSYLQNQKGSLSPYQFTYGDNNNDGTAESNYGYNRSQIDRWGNYKEDKYYAGLSGDNYSNDPDPYVKQFNDPTDPDAFYDEKSRCAAAWNLTKILLPSGGEIVIKYESDDYAYVQDKRAMQMFKVLGVCNDDDISGSSGSGYSIDDSDLSDFKTLYDGNDIDDINNYLIFQLEEEIEPGGTIDDYISDLDANHPMYFKCFVKLKKMIDGQVETPDWAYDYVEGYAHINEANCKLLRGNTGSNYKYGAICIKNVARSQRTFGEGSANAISKAAWEYMKLSRPDLLYPEPASAEDWASLGRTILTIGSGLSELFRGYYRTCWKNKWANELYLTEDLDWKPSWIRLNSPDGIKYGGGHRVARITSKDHWSTVANEDNTDLDGTYSIEYSYKLSDGRSSGVAAYEPIIGGEEIPLRLPTDKYSPSRTFLHAGEGSLYMEEPFGESYFPAPVVGYSRVIAKNGKPEGETTDINSKTQTGILEYNFYTAKDFPVVVTSNAVPDQLNYPTLIIPIASLGTYKTKIAGFSQGYRIELNDMHGQLKQVTTYPYSVDPDDGSAAFITRQEYIYKTNEASREKELNNYVEVIKRDGVIESRELGVHKEFLMDMQESSSFSASYEINKNVDISTTTYIPTGATAILPFITTQHAINISESNFRYAVTNKIIDRHGILMETRETKDGNTVISKNLVFDYYTGEPVLTSVTNQFEKPVYSYKYKGHWYYNNMGPAYQNYGYTYKGTINLTSGVFNDADAAANLYEGDKVLLSNSTTTTVAWVGDITGTNITFINTGGSDLGTTTASYETLRVIESIHRNQQSVDVGNIVTLNNPLTYGNSPLLTAFNSTVLYEENETEAINGTQRPLIAKDCGGTELSYKYFYGSNNINIVSSVGNEQCQIMIDVSEISGFASGQWDDVQITYVDGTSVKVTFDGVTYTCDLSTTGPDDCFIHPCEQKVLHAQASILNDNWTYNYMDAGDPYNGTGYNPLGTTNNPWRSGILGTWRVLSQHLYQTKREQASPTNIAYDGIYEEFTKFNWANPSINDINWKLVNEVTRYSPYGYELENKDVLGIYSSAVYGYENSVMTSMGANTPYFENGFDGFEDYSTGSGNYTFGHGHLRLSNYISTTNLPLETVPHTGKYSVKLNSVTATLKLDPSGSETSANTRYLLPVDGNKYIISYWAKPSVGGHVPRANVLGITSEKVTISKQQIEGWYRVEVEFVYDAGVTTGMNIGFENPSSPGTPSIGHIDDIRFHPEKAAFTSYVYDKATLWLLAELDNRNYATFYNYDEEGNLVQVKKETEKGVMTVQTGRKNVRRTL